MQHCSARSQAQKHDVSDKNGSTVIPVVLITKHYYIQICTQYLKTQDNITQHTPVNA